MSIKEQIWREILQQAISYRKFEFTQKEVAKAFGASLSTVFNALVIPRAQGAVKVTGRNFILVDLEKLLYIWATQRNLEKETIYQVFWPGSAKEIEGMMPPEIIFTAYSGFNFKYKEAPAEYSKVYVYAGESALVGIKKRFTGGKEAPNLFVLKSDPKLEIFGNIAPESQMFCDLWNLKDWYAKDFLNNLKAKILQG